MFPLIVTILAIPYTNIVALPILVDIALRWWRRRRRQRRRTSSGTAAARSVDVAVRIVWVRRDGNWHRVRDVSLPLDVDFSVARLLDVAIVVVVVAVQLIAAMAVMAAAAAARVAGGGA